MIGDIIDDLSGDDIETLDCILWAVTILAYWSIFGRCVTEGVATSILILVVCSVVGCLLGLTLSLQKWRITGGLFAGMGIYTAISYFDTALQGFIIGTILAMFLVVAAYFVWLLLKPHKRERIRSLWHKRIVATANLTYLLSVIGGVVIIGAMAIFSISARLKANNGAAAATTACNVTREELLMENYDGTVCMLQGNVWEGLSLEERCSVIQTICEIERQTLNLPDVSVSFMEIPETGTVGHYTAATRSIVIDTAYLQDCDPLDAVDIVAHEMFHCYQHDLVCWTIEIQEEIGDISDTSGFNPFLIAEQYATEFQNYKTTSNGDDYADYYNQLAEVDARAYAQAVSTRYAEFLES